MESNNMPEDPSTPQSPSAADLDFVQQPMVDWFDPRQLIRAGIKAFLSSIFGAYADKREIQAALQQSQPYQVRAPLGPIQPRSYTDVEEIWIDFIADVGDGWNSTYTMAWLLSRSALVLKQENQTDAQSMTTQRGRVLIMGGDEVYPTAKREEYHNRLVAPYSSALPEVPDRTSAPDLFAIPGNHDWYDGLTAFTRLFCQQRRIGRWQTQQSRSYFAIQLPHKWWLWGIDIQLDADIDKPQLDYFHSIAQEYMTDKGHQVILCTAEPSWVYTTTHGPEAYHNLDYFARKTIREYGNNLMLTLTGDLHHYCRYQEQGGSGQKITAGGGGAYLYGTHNLPATLELLESKSKTVPDDDGDNDDEIKKNYQRMTTFPSAKTSRRLTFGVLLFSFTNYWFALFLGFLYLLFAWIMQSASKSNPLMLLEKLSSLRLGVKEFGEALREFFAILLSSPASVVFMLILIFGLVAYCDEKKRSMKILLGSFHALLHLALSFVLIWGFARLNYHTWGMAIDKTVQALMSDLNLELWAKVTTQLIYAFLFSIEMLIFGGLIGGLLMSLYLLLSNLVLRLHTNEVFVAQHLADYKNFLRLHLDKNGTLTIYPIGVTKICRQWQLNTQATDGQSWFEPKPDQIAAHLIEAPIMIQPQEKIIS
jgi:hypothetical protein